MRAAAAYPAVRASEGTCSNAQSPSSSAHACRSLLSMTDASCPASGAAWGPIDGTFRATRSASSARPSLSSVSASDPRISGSRGSSPARRSRWKAARWWSPTADSTLTRSLLSTTSLGSRLSARSRIARALACWPARISCSACWRTGDGGRAAIDRQGRTRWRGVCARKRAARGGPPLSGSVISRPPARSRRPCAWDYSSSCCWSCWPNSMKGIASAERSGWLAMYWASRACVMRVSTSWRWATV